MNAALPGGQRIVRTSRAEARDDAGLDAVDGTPVLDLKPWMHEFAPRGPVHQPPWVAELMAAYS